MDPKQNDLSVDEDKKKKKRSQKKSDISNFIGEASPMSEGYMGGRIANECPVLDGIEKKCRGIDIMSGDSHQNLLEACGAHQLCYLCVSVYELGQFAIIFNPHIFSLTGRLAIAMRLRVLE